MGSPLFPYFLALLFPLMAAYGVWNGGFSVYLCLAAIAIAIPLGDLTLKQRETPLTAQAWWADLPLCLYPVLQCLLLISALNRVAEGAEQLGLALAVGISGAAGITVAHELIHRRRRW